MDMPHWNLPKFELIQVYTNCRTDIATHDEILRYFFSGFGEGQKVRGKVISGEFPLLYPGTTFPDCDFRIGFCWLAIGL
jgi:hypothetical protein